MLDKIELLSEEWKEEIEKLKKLDCPLILFGAGCTSQFIVYQLRGYGIFPEAFCGIMEINWT